MIHTARIIRMDDLCWGTLALLNMVAVQFGLAVSLWNCCSFHSTIPVHSHCTDMHHVTGLVVFHNCHQNVLCWLCVVCVCVIDCLNALHWVWSRTLLCQVYDYLRVECLECSLKLLLVPRYIDFSECYCFSCQPFPFLQPFLNRGYRSYTTVPVF